jgi:ribose-phosphate pyrophosphokinase
MSLQAKQGSFHFVINQTTFPGGEVLLNVHDSRCCVPTNQEPITITARIHNSNDLFALALLKDAITRELYRRGYQNRWKEIDLILPYVPYARQDRVCCEGEPHSLKVFADYINHLNFNTVTIIDPHSDVCGAVFNNLRIVSQLDIVNKHLEFIKRVLADVAYFVSPDAGANKKTASIAKYFEHKDFIRADKLRNLATGDIIETRVYCDDLKGQTVAIVDDICDGGRTFIELAKTLKAKNAGKVILFVTHGIFSKGEQALTNYGIDEIWTTDSYKEYNTFEKSTNVFKISNII